MRQVCGIVRRLGAELFALDAAVSRLCGFWGRGAGGWDYVGQGWGGMGLGGAENCNLWVGVKTRRRSSSQVFAVRGQACGT